MEHTLGVVCVLTIARKTLCLNPCFNGTYSRRLDTATEEQNTLKVLILVLMEHTLGELVWLFMLTTTKGLNPCFNGTYSRRFGFKFKEKFDARLNPCFNGTYSRSGNLL